MSTDWTDGGSDAARTKEDRHGIGPEALLYEVMRCAVEDVARCRRCGVLDGWRTTYGSEDWPKLPDGHPRAVDKYYKRPYEVQELVDFFQGGGFSKMVQWSGASHVNPQIAIAEMSKPGWTTALGKIAEGWQNDEAREEVEPATA